MSIGKKLNTILFILIAIIALSTVISFNSYNNIQESTKEAMDNRMTQVAMIDDIRYNIAMQGLYARAIIIDPSQKNEENLRTYAKKLDDNIAYLQEHADTDEMLQLVQQVSKFNDDFNVQAGQVIANYKTNITEAKNIVKNNLQSANVDILSTALEMEKIEKQRLEDIKVETANDIRLSKITSVVVLIISLIISAAAVLYIRKRIIKPLVQVSDEATKISDGDLTGKDIQVFSKDEIGNLANTFNTMRSNLRNLVFNVQQNTEHLSAASEELSASTQEITATTNDVTHRVLETAEAAQNSSQIAADSAIAMEETAIGVQRIAETTQTLHSKALTASEAAASGRKIITEAKDQMTTIDGSTVTVNELVTKLAKQTEEISSISQVITAITDQTNLLALNAAIEAARAGEHGKGFAVVADEVRKLAEESKNSATSIVALTQEIKRDTAEVEEAVRNSLASVKEGVLIIEKAGKSFNQIELDVEDMKNSIQDVSATSEQLSASAEEVTASVNEIAIGANKASESVEMIAAAMEEQSASMEQVNHVAISVTESSQQLQIQIQQFRV
ncbi:methyl-accepting chemotaxis protein [Solibacillus sp. MA9]|uniref:Methyl-accepting chemotaxis protein n=1 Tax=Solibacillus palustris TaxID=2908203 RepID=A0ABS9UGE6_9BACL|nr:HAMP domain-containing methyl-accepting chemotaxis protein [Solibacillus sp. MA9]MCH7323417.1 methyl-accepting chemotaxis protein [Solibacillus sp. MA9]